MVLTCRTSRCFQFKTNNFKLLVLFWNNAYSPLFSTHSTNFIPIRPSWSNKSEHTKIMKPNALHTALKKLLSGWPYPFSLIFRSTNHNLWQSRLHLMVNANIQLQGAKKSVPANSINGLWKKKLDLCYHTIIAALYLVHHLHRINILQSFVHFLSTILKTDLQIYLTNAREQWEKNYLSIKATNYKKVERGG